MSYHRKLLAMAKVSKQTERYEDMAEYLKMLAILRGALNVEERNLLNVAYKAIVSDRRAAWFVVSRIESSLENPIFAEELKVFREKLEKELSTLTGGLLKLLDETLLRNASSISEEVFYLRLKGDYYRYQSEYAVADQQMDLVKKTQDTYSMAIGKAEGLHVTDPVRLSLAVNYAVFQYETTNDYENAVSYSQKVYDDAISQLDDVKSDTFQDCMSLLQILRANIEGWAAERPKEPEVLSDDSSESCCSDPGV